MQKKVKKLFPASLDSLHEMLAFIRKESIKSQFNTEEINKIVLAAEEALVNVIKHGYGEKEGEKIEIICKPSFPEPGIEVIIKDNGIPFNPVQKVEHLQLKHEQILNASSIEDVSLGGYGVYIYVGVMDHVDYQHLNGKNHLSLTKYRS